MDQYEEYFEKEEEVEVENEEAPQPMIIPLEVVVGPVAGSPESPSLSPLPPMPSPPMPSPPQGSQAGDATSLMGFCTHDDIVQLEQWVVHAGATRGIQPATLRSPLNLPI